MANNRVYNFSSGPSMLPLSALTKAAEEMTSFKGSGMSVMEMSHRGKLYLSIFDETKARLKSTLNIPDTHEILFMQGGATFQFSAVPLNLMGENGVADYALTGNFSTIASKEAKKYGAVNIAVSSEDRNHTYIPSPEQIKLTPGASYFHYCANNTIYGTEWKYIPETNGAPLVCDMSSNLLSKPVDVSKYGIIYAGVQKNMGPAGMAVVIIDKALAGKELPFTPKVMSYKTAIDKDSMDNTPPAYTIYMLGLVLEWLEAQGGVTAMEKINVAKAKLLYDFIDESTLFSGCAELEARSLMNVTFTAGNDELDALFCKEATAAGLETLKGHRLVNKMRASIYNAMPVEGVEALVKFMKEFEAGNKA